jgi:hypothetical protein
MAAVAPRASSMALAPAAAASADSPAATLRAARWYATSELLQAVLVGTQGPARPNV